MNSNIEPFYYHVDEIYEKEKLNIFQQNWRFVGFLNDLKKENDFFTANLDGKPIVVQLMQGRIKAFLNVCSHRFSIIQTKKKGNRPLMCPYHGWTYSNEGVPVGIPKKPLFENYTKDELCKMKLTEFRVETCGSLIFVNLKNDSADLREFLGKFYSPIEKMTNAFGIQIDTNSMLIRANWKIIVENTMEAYHLSLVHADTLAKLMPITNMENLTFDFEPPHSNYIIPLKTKIDSKKLKFTHKPFEHREWNLDGFQHYLIFPNILLSSSYGTTFNLTLLEPKSSSETIFTSNVFIAKFQDGYSEEDTQEFIKKAIEYNRKIFDEDKDICEMVQKGVGHTQQQGVLSLEELRVKQFQEDYKLKMTSE